MNFNGTEVKVLDLIEEDFKEKCEEWGIRIIDSMYYTNVRIGLKPVSRVTYISKNTGREIYAYIFSEADVDTWFQRIISAEKEIPAEKLLELYDYTCSHRED